MIVLTGLTWVLLVLAWVWFIIDGIRYIDAHLNDRVFPIGELDKLRLIISLSAAFICVLLCHLFFAIRCLYKKRS